MIKFEDLKVGQVLKYRTFVTKSTRYELILKTLEQGYYYYDFTYNQIRFESFLDSSEVINNEVFHLVEFQTNCNPEIIPICELFKD